VGLATALVIITYIPHLIVPENFFHRHPDTDDFSEPRHRRIEFLFAFREHFFQFLVVIVFSFFLKLNQRLKLTQQEKKDAELSYLKAQINPHFLFNTLNGIYSTAVGEGAPDTANAVVQLSGMMRYVTSEAERDYVSVEKEIEYISSYVELQKVRLGNTVQIDYSVRRRSEGRKISPLILIAFIENAFKYGVNPEKPSHISIEIEIIGDVLILSVENNKVKKNLSDDERTGMGIENTKGRLNHLYSGKYNLKIDENDEKFHLVLKIDLG
jgi:sensor histidine kinase YesM